MAKDVILLRADGTTQTFKGVKTVRTRDTSGVFNNRFPDVSEDTIAPEKVLEGESFHGADGKLQSGIIPTYDNVFEGGVILPSGSATLATKTATVNGTYDALNDGADGYSTFIVAVPEKEPDVGSIEITENGTYKASDEGYDGYDEITVNVPTAKADPTLTEKSITANGEYLATDDNADGYSKVVVDVPSERVAEYDGAIEKSESVLRLRKFKESVTPIDGYAPFDKSDETTLQSIYDDNYITIEQLSITREEDDATFILTINGITPFIVYNEVPESTTIVCGRYVVKQGGEVLFDDSVVLTLDSESWALVDNKFNVLSTANSTVDEWLLANTENASPLTTTIEYNGETIAELNSGETATLSCENMKMVSDVIVKANEVVLDLQEKSITVNENSTVEITADEGNDGLSKATVIVDVPSDIIEVDELPSENIDTSKYYKMGDALYKYDDSIVGTWVFNDNITTTEFDVNLSFNAINYSTTGKAFARIRMVESSGVYYLNYYPENSSDSTNAAFIKSSGTTWQSGSYFKTIDIYEEPTDETFIAWVKANAIRKGAWEEYVVPNGSLSIELTSPLTTEFDVANYEKVSATAKAQDKTITITENGSTVVARDNGYAGMDNVYITTNVPIPDGYIKPSGSVTITANGTTDVTEKETVVVNVQPKTQTKSTTITSNGTTTISKDSAYDGMTSVSITTNVQPNLQQISQTYTENGQYELAPSTSYDGIVSAQITVNVPTSPTPTEISTESAMTSALSSAEIGTLYKYTGTSGTYEQNAIYIVEEV